MRSHTIQYRPHLHNRFGHWYICLEQARTIGFSKNSLIDTQTHFARINIKCRNNFNITGASRTYARMDQIMN